MQHSTNGRSSHWGAFKEELARCQATSGCNVDGVYQRWTAIGNDQQKLAMSSIDAMLGADPSAAAEAGKSFGATAAAATSAFPAIPADVYMSELSGSQGLWTLSASLQHDRNICFGGALVNNSIETSNRGR